MNILEIMAAPFAECMVLVAIHTYLGIHVLKRRVIFVDLALAQTAALGTTMGFVFGILPESGASLVFSIVFATIGAAIFALTRMKSDTIPQEAVIGLFYAICAAMAILVIQKTSGAEHVDDILVGSILWAKWGDVGIAAIAYSAVGIVHYLFRKQFMLISESPQKAYESGLNVRFWDFLFYLTFGFVISFSVRIAGVLLVFVFLVAPAIMAFLLTQKLKYQLLIGWATGTLVTVMGLAVSYFGDFPSGPAVIVLYGVVLVIQGIVYYLLKSPVKMVAARNVIVGIAATAAISAGIYFLGTILSRKQNVEDTQLAKVAQRIAEDNKQVEQKRKDEEAKQIHSFEPWIQKYVSNEKIRQYVKCGDALAKMEFIQAFPDQSAEKAALAISFLSDPQMPAFFKNQALDVVESYANEKFECDVEKGIDQLVINQMKQCLLKHRI
ncbi:MAG: metal ABC transporter permease [Deltaproteobacteria bacterium]|nr:metal ABC transporter permease [Deltaproteobacteria bacterium]MBN2670848.1 metal ABC transporter permease [Deltaproteobacteria bacterium]